MGKKLTFEQVRKLFKEQGRSDIEIFEEGFVSWKRDKAAFKVVATGEIFWALPQRLYVKNY